MEHRANRKRKHRQGLKARRKTGTNREGKENHPSAAKAVRDCAALTARLKPCPFKAASLSATCHVRGLYWHAVKDSVSTEVVVPPADSVNAGVVCSGGEQSASPPEEGTNATASIL